MRAKSFISYLLFAALLVVSLKEPFTDAGTCADGRFGLNCEFQCHCAGGSTCTDGICIPDSCDDSWEGYKCQIGKNVARNKNVSLSSNIPLWNRDKQLAVDGNRNRDFYRGGSCVSTSKEKNPWLRIDLGDTYVVQEVTIATVGRGLFYVWDRRVGVPHGTRLFPKLPATTLVSYSLCLERCMNTTGCIATTSCTGTWGGNGCWKVTESPQRYARGCKHSVKLETKLENLYIRVGNAASQISDNSLCKSTPLNITGDTERSISCDHTAIGRYVFLQLNSPDYRVLAVCEVMVKGFTNASRYLECTRGLRGDICEENCPDTCGTGTNGCNKFTSVCCSAYKTGAFCDKDLPALTNPPRKVSVTSSSLTLAWDKWTNGIKGTGVGPVDKYIIQYMERNSPTWLSETVHALTHNSQNVTKTIERLKYNTYYLFRVACVLSDRLGDVVGKYTAVTTIKTGCTVPSDIPSSRILIKSTLVGTSNATLSISWPAVRDEDSGCDRIKHYKVKYKKTDAAVFLERIVNGNAHHSISIADLSVYTAYDVMVEAYNNEDKMSTSNLVSHTTIQGIPSGAPQNVEVHEIKRRSATLKWEKVPRNQRNGNVVKYIYQIKGLQYTTLDKRVYTNSTVLSAEISSLTPYALYTVKVAAATEAGPGTSYSDALTFRTLEDVPPAPRHVTITGSQPTTIYVAWTAPYPPHGVIQKYEIEYTKKSGDTVNYTIDKYITGFKLENLETSVNYSIRVRAKTSAGWGAWSITVLGSTEEGVPSPPLSYELMKRTASSLLFSWNEPKHPNGLITGYLLTCNETTVVKEVPYTSREITLDGLLTERLYICRLQAKTRIGYGSLSPEILAWTLPYPPVLFSLSAPRKEPMITDSTITFHLPVFKDDRINSYEVFVDMEDSTRQSRAVLDLNQPNSTSCSEKPSQRDVYITAKITPNLAKGTFKVGDSKMYGGYWNCPLIKESIYSVFYAAVVESLNGDKARTFVFIGTYKTPGEQITLSTAALVIGIVLGLMCIALSCALAVMAVKMKILRKREAEKDKQYTDLTTLHHEYSGIEKPESSVGTLEEFLKKLNGESSEYENAKEIKGKSEIRREEPNIYEEVKDATN